MDGPQGRRNAKKRIGARHAWIAPVRQMTAELSPSPRGDTWSKEYNPRPVDRSLRQQLMEEAEEGCHSISHLPGPGRHDPEHAPSVARP
jgi:hypothetical protein